MRKATLSVDIPIRLGVSSCLLENAVRHDGGHERDRFLTDLLGSFAEWVPVCPDLEVGTGIPRPALRLVRDGDTLNGQLFLEPHLKELMLRIHV